MLITIVGSKHYGIKPGGAQTAEAVGTTAAVAAAAYAGTGGGNGSLGPVIHIQEWSNETSGL